MKKKILMAGGLAAIISASMAFGAVAATNLEEVKAYLNKGITLKLNGQTWEAKDSNGNRLYPITYEGSTYLPVRSVGEALGVKIGWDRETNTVLIGEDQAVAPSQTGYSRSNPAAVGETVAFKVANFMEEYEGTLKLTEVVRGEKAWEAIKAANPFNSPATDGHEYIIAKFDVKITKNKNPDAQVELNNVLFTAVSSDGRDYDMLIGMVPPEPAINTKLYVNASHSGWAVFMVRKDDANPLITFGRNYDGTGGVWFKVE